MSTWVYLECLDHDPPLRSDGESGQHLTDLPQIRSDIANRDLIVAAVKADFEIGELEHHFRRNTVRFLVQHPSCRVGIRDEYGSEHATVEDEVSAR